MVRAVGLNAARPNAAKVDGHGSRAGAAVVGKGHRAVGVGLALLVHRDVREREHLALKAAGIVAHVEVGCRGHVVDGPLAIAPGEARACRIGHAPHNVSGHALVRTARRICRGRLGRLRVLVCHVNPFPCGTSAGPQGAPAEKIDNASHSSECVALAPSRPRALSTLGPLDPGALSTPGPSLSPPAPPFPLPFYIGICETGPTFAQVTRTAFHRYR